MNLGILLIGDELLDGSIKDINASYLGELIQNKSINVVESVTVGDDINMIKEAYGFVKNRCDVVIVSGGLGPTPDDRTRFALSEFYNFTLQFDKDNWEIVEQMFKNRDSKILESNKVQSFKPIEFSWIDNKQGTAAGLTYCDGATTFYSLPGVPFEFSKMIETIVLPDIEKNFDITTDKIERLLFAGIGESTIYSEVKDLEESKEISYLPNAAKGVLVKYKAAQSIIKDRLVERLSDYIVSYDGASLEYTIVKELKEKGLTLSLAESCTGGSVCGKLTTISGASEVIMGGINCYMTSIKTSLLSVPNDIIDTFGVVSKECATSLAANVRKTFHSDISFSVTGYLGSTGGDKFAEVGTVYFGLSSENSTESVYYKMGLLDRDVNKQLTVQRALFNILKFVRSL